MSRPSPEQVATLLAGAWAAVESAGLPEHDQGDALRTAANLMNDKPVVSTDDAGVGAPSAPAPTPKAKAKEDPATAGSTSYSPTVGEDEFFATLTSETSLTDEQLRRLFYVKDGLAHIGMSRSKLGVSGADKLRSIGLLMLGAQYFLTGEKDLPLTLVRNEAKLLHQETGTNLNKYLGSVPGTTTRNNGTEQCLRVVEAKFSDAFENAARALLGET